MVRYYPVEIRAKVLEAIDKGIKQSEITKVFGIHRTTIFRWEKLKEETQSLKPNLSTDIKKKKMDIDRFKKYIDKDNPEKNYNKTLKEMAVDFGVSHVDIWYHLKKLGYVIKKN